MPANDPPPPIAPAFEGWEPRFIGSEPRLSEVAEMYREIGFEVLLRPYDPAECIGCCNECFGGGGSATMVVYTKPAD